ncbi:Nitric oxide reductase FlRd-NAD(+) reductase [Enterobacter cloacae]|uniref:Nitric oxide reductase FlRd-NAD(+) reductase n=1 Tax=Enterobacter cloacae TaxID=550 RepID=A0A377LTJ2_ENTCL|nr:Nitric oxide reductase FlRd-NAD(+) reductase [Enterobacter cloacae]
MKVNSYLQTTQPDIYALGDCAEINGQVLPFLQPIQLSAMYLAKNLLGNSAPLKLPAMLVKVKTPALPLHLAGENPAPGPELADRCGKLREWSRAALTPMASSAPSWLAKIG